MPKVQYFKAATKTKRFNENQRVWVSHRFANHSYIWFRWRGSGRYVTGIIDNDAPAYGELKTIEVDQAFADRIQEQ